MKINVDRAIHAPANVDPRFQAVDRMSMGTAEAMDRAMGCRASKKHCRKTMDLAPSCGECDACRKALAEANR